MERNRVVVNFTGQVSRTKQSFKNECNINTIMAKARKTGLLPVASKDPYYGDFSGAVDFHTAQNNLIAAEKQFMTLPASVRRRFGNDPGNLIAFLDKEENRDEAVKLGIVKASEPSAEQKAAQAAAIEAERKAKLKIDLKGLGVVVP